MSVSFVLFVSVPPLCRSFNTSHILDMWVTKWVTPPTAPPVCEVELPVVNEVVLKKTTVKKKVWVSVGFTPSSSFFWFLLNPPFFRYIFKQSPFNPTVLIMSVSLSQTEQRPNTGLYSVTWSIIWHIVIRFHQFDSFICRTDVLLNCFAFFRFQRGFKIYRKTTCLHKTCEYKV